MKRTRHSFLAHGRAILVAALLLVTLPWTMPAHAASFTVDWPYDEFDMNPGDGACISTPSGGCTLRAAIQEAETQPANAHVITISPAFITYKLIYGDLDIAASTNLTIIGNGPGQTIISSNGNDRLFEIGPGANLAIFKMTITGGIARSKSGPTIPPGSYLRHGHGGAIHNHGTLTLIDSTVINSVSEPNSNWGGGGISNAGNVATANLINVTVADNTTPNHGGGIENTGALKLYNVTIVNNQASTGGSGIFNDSSAILANTILADNIQPGRGTNNCAGSRAISSGGYNLTSDASPCNFSATTHDVINIPQYFDVADRQNGIYSLLSGPAVDGGYPGSGPAILACPSSDQLGALRPVDGNGDGVAHCDIGAVELKPIDLSLNMTDSPDPAMVGRPLIYTLNITNLGPEPALYVTMFDALPAAVTLSQITSTAGSAQVVCNPGNGGVNCTIDRIAVGATVTIWIQVAPTTIGVINNWAMLNSPKPDRNPSNDTASESTTVNLPPLGLNLLSNPGFERDDDGDGLPDDWSGSNAFIRDDQLTHSGGYAGLHVFTEDASHMISQTVANLTAGQTYIFLGYVWISPDDFSPSRLDLQVQWIDSNGIVVAVDRIKTYTRPTNNIWDQVIKSMVAPDSAVAAEVRMLAGGGSSGISVDDFSFSQ